MEIDKKTWLRKTVSLKSIIDFIIKKIKKWRKIKQKM